MLAYSFAGLETSSASMFGNGSSSFSARRSDLTFCSQLLTLLIEPLNRQDRKREIDAQGRS